MIKDIKVTFKTKEGRRFDDTPVHKAGFQIFFSFEKIKVGFIKGQFDFNRMIQCMNLEKTSDIYEHIGISSSRARTIMVS